jgi:hypothetical protein
LKVIDFSPWEWYLLSWETEFILEVDCSRSFLGISITIQLTPSETARYIESGKSFIVELARRVNISSMQKESKIFDRGVSRELNDLVTESIVKFNKENNI